MTIFYLIVLGIIVTFFVGAEFAFAETESLIIAARSYERVSIFLNAGDEVDFIITVRGGVNDDINLIVGIPGEDIVEGLVVESHEESFTAPASGTYVFTFDNTISRISNKSVQFSYEITKNTYYVYVEPLPNYASDYASNSLYTATEYWKTIFPKKNFFVTESSSDADIIVQWVKDFTGMKHVGFQYVELIEVGLGDSNCLSQWNPYSSKHVTEILTHEIGHALGLEHSNDSNSIMYPTVSSTSYGIISQQFNLGENQGMLIPLCMSKESSSIQYDVKSSDSKYGFDVYVVPSKEDFDNILQYESFEYYSGDNCFGEGFLNYNGQCKGTTIGSGLAIIQKSPLSFSTTTINVNYFETEFKGRADPIDSKIFSLIHDTATIDVRIFGDKFDFSSSSFQDKDGSIKFENGDGQIIHKYDTWSSIGDLFDSVGMSLSAECIVITDGRSFCENDDYSLKFLVNGQEFSTLTKYAFNDGDRIEISYDAKPAPSIIAQPKSIPESKSTSSVQQEEKSNTICGEGTILKDGECIVDSNSSTTNSGLGGGCLIATATYGSELASQVQTLRELRDNKLLQTNSGSAFIQGFNEFYYSFSPVIADFERENPIFRESVKLSLTPMISSLSILNYVDMNTEADVLGYGISLIVLNVGMYFVAPAIVIVGIRKKF